MPSPDDLARRTADLERERITLQQIAVATLEALVNALEAKDPYLRGHSARVADMAASVAAELKLPDDEIDAVRTAGRLHDIGKIGVREEIITKQGPLTDAEFEEVKRHTTIGAEILAPLVYLGPVIQYVRSHHERWDGKGYPDGIRGNAIPLGARIIGAAEIYDALATSRSYQEKMSPELAVERMGHLVGTVLDPAVLQALRAVVARREHLVFLDDRRP
jgi:putative nucleotidyltransferase with HDIG domain